MKNSKHLHWHYIYRRRRQARTISTKEILIGQIIALSGSLVAGLLLDINKHTLTLFVGAFLLMPGLIDLAASITGAMCAKINHHLDSGKKASEEIIQSVLFAAMMVVTTGLIVGICGGIIGEIFFEATFWQIIVLCECAMIIVGCITFPLMALLTLAIRKTGADADNIIGPVETGFTDMLTVIVISLLVRLFV